MLKIKKYIIMMFISTLALIVLGCAKEQVEVSTETITGYIVIEDNRLYFDEVEIITAADTERMEELGL